MANVRADKVFGMGDSIAAESELQVIRAERAARRSGKQAVKDIGENEGIDYDANCDAPLPVGQDMGYMIEPFNMRREHEEGSWDQDGNYVRDLEIEKQVTDSWLDQVDEGAQEAAFKSEQARAKAIGGIHRIARPKVESAEDLCKELIAFLEGNETPRDALQRLAGHKSKLAATGPKLPWEKRKAREAAPKAVVAPKAKKKRRKLTEWGYVEVDEEGNEIKKEEVKEEVKDEVKEEPATNGDASTPGSEKENHVKTEANGTDEGDRKRPAPTDEASGKRARTDTTAPVMDRLTEICDQMMQQGYFDVFTTAKSAIHLMEKATPDVEPEHPDDDDDEEKKKDVDSEDEEGMAAADVEMADAAIEQLEGGPSVLDLLDDIGPPTGIASGAPDDAKWQYKWEENGDAFGPFTTDQIYTWKASGMFANGVWARQCDASGEGIDEWQILKSDAVELPAGAATES